MEMDALEIILSEASVLPDPVVKTLISRAQRGDKRARERLVKSNLRLVRSLVNRYGTLREREDLFQVGCIGLVKAIERFDPSYDVKFSTYAVPLIIGEIRCFLRDDGMLKMSRSLRETARRIMECGERLERRLGREPTLSEIAKALNLPREEIIEALEASRSIISLYEPVRSGENDESLMVMDQISTGGDMEYDLVNSLALREMMKRLDERERKILLLRFFGRKTQVEVSRIIGISQVQVSRIEKKALLKLKEELLK